MGWFITYLILWLPAAVIIVRTMYQAEPHLYADATGKMIVTCVGSLIAFLWPLAIFVIAVRHFAFKEKK